MSYLEPKINWSSTDGVMDADFNRIEGNIKYLSDNGVYKATCLYDTNVFTLSLINAPAILPDIFTVNVKIPNEWVDASTFKIDDVTYTPNNAGFVADEVVNITFDNGVAKKCFFKSGGGGITETLPQQVDTFTATVGNGTLNFFWGISNTDYLDGFYIIYKPGTNAPTHLNDGVKIDITNPYATRAQATGLINGQIYACRIMPYNDKKQVQTQYKVLTATPSDNISINELPIGSKILGIKNVSDNTDMPMILIDKNHSGYPSNSITLILEKSVGSLAQGAPSYIYSTIGETWLTGTFWGYLPASLRSLILPTTIACATGWGRADNKTQYTFLLSIFELDGTAPQGTVQEGFQFSYFASETQRKSNTGYWTRTPGINTGGTDTTFKVITDNGVTSSLTYTSAFGIRPVFNITKNNTLRVKPTVNAQGYYELVV